MSQLTQCNYCSLKQYKSKARKNNQAIRLVDNPGVIKGIDVLISPKGLRLPRLGSDERDAFIKRYFVAWFMELGDHCEC